MPRLVLRTEQFGTIEIESESEALIASLYAKTLEASGTARVSYGFRAVPEQAEDGRTPVGQDSLALAKEPKTQADRLYLALRDIGRPAKVKEIADLAARRYGFTWGKRTIAARAARQALMNNPNRFVRHEEARFGLTGWDEASGSLSGEG